MQIPRQDYLDDPDFLMRELLADYAQDWIDVQAAAIEAGHFLFPEPSTVQ